MNSIVLERSFQDKISESQRHKIIGQEQYNKRTAYLIQNNVKDGYADSWAFDFISFATFSLLYQQKLQDIILLRHKDNNRQKLIVQFKIHNSQKIRQFLHKNSLNLITISSLPDHFEIIIQRIVFPSIVWISYTDEEKQFVEEKVQKIAQQWLVNESNLICSIRQQNEQLFRELALTLPLFQNKIKWISKYIGFFINSDNDMTNLQKSLHLVNEMTEKFQLYFQFINEETTKYVYQLNNILELIKISTLFKSQNISFEYISEESVKSMSLIIANTNFSGKESQISLIDINENNKNKDLIYFEQIWNESNQNLKKQLQFACSNWDMCSPFYEKQLQMFQDLFARKISPITIVPKIKLPQKTFPQIKLCPVLFPQLQIILRRIQKVNSNYIGNEKNIVPKNIITDELILSFIATLQKKRLQKNFVSYKMNQENTAKIPLSDYIANLQQYKKNQKLGGRSQRIFAKIQNQFRSKELQDNSQDRQNKNPYNFLQGLQNERLASIECINCCPFFYQDFNIFNPAINLYPIVLLPAISRIRELQSSLKDEICWLLNNNGGVILFDCLSKNREIFPKGDIITLQQKSQIEQRISSYMQNIYPQPEARNYSITFVPIIKNPLKQGRKQSKKTVMEGSTYENTYYQRQFIEGVYVARIKVNPTIGERLYFWINDEKPIFPKKVKNNIVYTPGKNILQLIKKKFKEYYIPQNAVDKEQRRFCQPKISYFHDGDCTRPDLGLQILKNKQQKRQPKFDDFEKAYRYMSIILVKKQYLNTIKERLLKRKIKFQIECKFQKYRFKYTQNSAVIYHDLRFEQLMNEVEHKKQFQFENKYIKLLKISEFIKLTDRNHQNIFPEDDFNNYQNYFSKEYPNQKIKLWKYTNEQQQIQFYFQAGSKTQNLFLFYILIQYKEQIKFKYPKNYDKFTPADRALRFKLFYPRNCPQQQVLQKSNQKQSTPFKFHNLH